MGDDAERGLPCTLCRQRGSERERDERRGCGCSSCKKLVLAFLVSQPSSPSNGHSSSVDVRLPDLHALSGMILEMEDTIHAIDDQLDDEKKRVAQQKNRIQGLMEDVKSHLEYVSSNFPLNFGKSPAKPKQPKYGINVPPRKSVAVASKPAAKGAGKAPGRPAAEGRSGKPGAPAAAAAATGKGGQAGKAPPSARKPVVAPVVLSGPAIVGSRNSKPAIPVRMTKKFLTTFNHNVNKQNK